MSAGRVEPGRGWRLPRATWVLADQAVLSLGTFLLSILLARHLPLATFGQYALFLSALSLAQAFSGSVIFYPLAVRATVLDPDHRRELIGSALVLTVLLGAPLAVVFGALVGHLVERALFAPAACVLLLGQLQECTRRGLLSDFRHRQAIPGDLVSYAGQIGAAALLARWSLLSLPAALYAMAATSAAGAWLQLWQTGAHRARKPRLRATLSDFWSLGRWSLGSNALIAIRSGAVPWLLASFAGPAAAGAFQLILNVVNVTNPITIGLSNVIPQAAARGQSAGARAAARLSGAYLAAGLPFVGALGLAMILLPGPILSVAYGQTAPDPSLLEGVRIMAGGAMFGFVAAGMCAHLYGTGDGPIALAGDAASSVAVLVSMLPLIGSLGLVGACLAAALGLLVRAAWMIAFVLRRLAEDRHRPAAASFATSATESS